MTLRDDQLRALEAFADGRLDGNERGDAERLLSENPEAAEIVRSLAEADAAVRRLFDPPTEFDPALGAESVASSGRAYVAGSVVAGGRRPWVRWALAAGLFLAACGAYVANFVLVTSPDSLYGEFVAAGFEPAWKCKDQQEFLEYSRARTGGEFLVAEAPGVQVLGWDSGNDLVGETTVSLWSRADGRPVVVFIDRAADDHTVRLRPFSGLHLHRGQLGETVFYEVSPLDHPVVLPLVHRPSEAPGAMKLAPGVN